MKNIYIKSHDQHSFRCGEWAKITGLIFIQPNSNLTKRICYKLLFEDGAVDFWPVYDSSTLYHFKEE
jgi:hypothetical protein